MTGPLLFILCKLDFYKFILSILAINQLIAISIQPLVCVTTLCDDDSFLCFIVTKRRQIAYFIQFLLENISFCRDLR